MAALTLSEKLDQLDARYQEMTQELSTPEVVTDSARCAHRPPKPRAPSTPQQPQSPFSLKPTKSTSKSKPKICALTPSALPARAASPSTPPIPPSASLTCPRAWWSLSRTKNPKSKIAPKPCASCVPVSTKWNSISSKPPSGPNAAARSKPATAPKKSAPTTHTKTGTPTTPSPT